MREEVKNRLPCLLDRLVDESPGHKADPLQRRTVSLPEYRTAVLRDLRWLLNSACHLEGEPLYDYPMVRSSVLNYGTRDLAGMTSNSFDELKLEQDLRDSILAFEPRIIPDSLQVRISRDGSEDGKIAFEIDGQLWALPYAERVMFRTEMDLETGVCELNLL